MTSPRAPNDDLPPEAEDAHEPETAGFDMSDDVLSTDDAPETPESVKRGVAVIRQYWKHAPNTPGVWGSCAC